MEETTERKALNVVKRAVSLFYYFFFGQYSHGIKARSIAWERKTLSSPNAKVSFQTSRLDCTGHAL